MNASRDLEAALRATRLPARALGTGAVEIDARGTFCPVPLIEAARVIGRLAPPWSIEILADDPDAPGDFADWARAAGHTARAETLARGWRILIIMKTPQDPERPADRGECKATTTRRW